MEQRIYRGVIDLDALANYLVQHYDPQQNLQAQKLGEAGTHLVQIGHGDVPEDLRHAVTVALVPSQEEEGVGIAVTMGQQQWLNTSTATKVAAIGLVSLLITPFALFGLLWPLSEAVGSVNLVEDIWNTIDTYVISQGGSLGKTVEIQHPHVG